MAGPTGAQGEPGASGPTGPTGAPGIVNDDSCPAGQCVIAVSGGQLVCGACGGGDDEVCAGSTTQIGHWCIDVFQRPVQNYGAATATCHAENMSICPIEAYMVCDLINLSASGCGVATDTPQTQLWTGSFDPSFDTRVFQGIATYGGDEIVRQGNAGNFHPYYCCKPTGAP